jgi:hypothetical protein
MLLAEEGVNTAVIPHANSLNAIETFRADISLSKRSWSIFCMPCLHGNFFFSFYETPL